MVGKVLVLAAAEWRLNNDTLERVIWYRDGFVWVPAPAALAEQREGLAVGALKVTVDGTDALPAMGDCLDFHLLIEGERLGPLAGRVVHVDGQDVALHLDDAAQRALRGKLPAEPAPAAPSAPPATADSVGRAELVGQLYGRLTLGMVPYLFADQPAGPPPPTCSVVRLLRHLADASAQGVLTITGAGYTKRVSLARGVVVNVTVKPIKEDEQLGQLLLGAQWITPHKLADVLRWARKDKIPIGSALLQSGLLDDARLNRALAHQTFRRLRDLFEWDGAGFAFDASEAPSQGSAPLSINRLLHELALDVFRSAPLGDLTELLSTYSERFPRLEGDPAYLRRLVADDKLLRACQRVFGGDRTLRQAMTALVADRPKTARLVLYLVAARGLTLYVEPPDVPEARLAQVLRERVRTLGVQDAFQRLGVKYWAHSTELERARQQRLKVFGADGRYHRVDSKAAATICQMIEEAVLLVASPAARRKYRERVLGKERLAIHARLVAEERDFFRAEQREAEARRADEVLGELRP